MAYTYILITHIEEVRKNNKGSVYGGCRYTQVYSTLDADPYRRRDTFCKRCRKRLTFRIGTESKRRGGRHMPVHLAVLPKDTTVQKAIELANLSNLPRDLDRLHKGSFVRGDLLGVEE